MSQLPPESPRPGYYLAVVGADRCPEGLLFRTLDALTARVRVECQLVVISRGGDETSEWIRRHATERVTGQLEPVCRANYGRFAEARWAMRVCGSADALLVFGDRGRWRRLLRYASEVGVPFKIVPVPVDPEPARPLKQPPPPPPPPGPEDWRRWLPPD